MNPNTLFYALWALAVIFAFIGFVTFAQQGKANGRNTWWFRHKSILGIICVLIVAGSLAYLKFGF